MTKPALPEPSPNFVSIEAWERWCADPVTRFVAASYEHMIEEQEKAWMQASWRSGNADEKTLTELRTRADCYAGFCDTDYLTHASHLLEHTGLAQVL